MYSRDHVGGQHPVAVELTAAIVVKPACRARSQCLPAFSPMTSMSLRLQTQHNVPQVSNIMHLDCRCLYLFQTLKMELSPNTSHG